MMTPGEKRSVTSSMKKAFEVFSPNGQTQTTEEFYQFWVNYSIDNKLSWCFDKKSGIKEYHQKENFKQEMIEKIREFMPNEEVKTITSMRTKEVMTKTSQTSTEVKEIASLQIVEKKLRPLRSKKKRLRKKREKIYAM